MASEAQLSSPARPATSGTGSASRLAEKGSPPRAMARKPGKAQDLAAAGCEIVPGDVLRRETLAEPLDGIKVAYYLVHSMGRGGQGDFADRDEEGAENFAAAAAEAGVKQIVYLGGLSDGGSKHLESRHATAEHLASTGRARHLPARRRRDRRGQRVVSDPLLPDQAPAGDGDPEVGQQPHPADRDRRPDRDPLPGAEDQGREAGRTDRHRRPRRHHLRRDDGLDGEGDGTPQAPEGAGAGAEPRALVPLGRSRHARGRRRRPPAGPGPLAGDGRQGPRGHGRSSTSNSPRWTTAMQRAIDEGGASLD